jgi:hypothetical protein
LLAVLAKGLNTTEVLWDEMQHSPYFNYKAADGLIHQVRLWSMNERGRKGIASTIIY